MLEVKGILEIIGLIVGLVSVITNIFQKKSHGKTKKRADRLQESLGIAKDTVTAVAQTIEKLPANLSGPVKEKISNTFETNIDFMKKQKMNDLIQEAVNKII